MLSLSKHRHSLILTFTVVWLQFIFACNQPDILPSYTGQTGELLLVQGKGVKVATVKTVKRLLEKEIDYLPQSEKSFTVFIVPENKLRGIYKKHRNIFYIKKTNENRLYRAQNVWSKNQLVYTWNTTGSIGVLKNKIADVIATYNLKEIERLHLGYKKTKTTDVISKLHNITLKLPQHYAVAKNNKQVFWLRKESKETSFGIVGYYSNNRDSVLKYNISGPSEGSYMKTIDFNNSKIRTITRGIWELENDFMGGSFIERTIPLKNDTIKIYAYLYAPSKKKRELMRELEAIVKSVEYKQGD